MGKVKGKHRLDKYYHLAKEHGYRSRAAWKLVQLDSKFGFLRSAHSVLDLCAAPGGWMQVSVERVPVGSLVVGADLVPIRPIRGAISVREDITEPKFRSTVKRIMSENGCRAFDVVLHDGSPNVGGAWAKEAMGQNALVIDSVKLLTEFLAPRGTFVTKVFRSQDYTAVLYCLRQLFEKVEVDKPQASRSASAEIYVLGLKYKAPAKIDPRLLDVKHLFQGGKEPPKIIDVLRGTKQKRHRDGYEDGDTTLRKLCSAADFIWSETPLEILGSVTAITFSDDGSLPIRDHTLTTEEVKALCEDLRVIGKQDFKHLLKWRVHMRKALSPAEKAASAKPVSENEGKEDANEAALNEMESLINSMEQKKKRAKKNLAKRLAKDKARKALGKQTDAIDDGYFDQELFSLSSIKACRKCFACLEKKDLVAVNDEEDAIFDDFRNSDCDFSNDEEAEEKADSDVDSEEEKRRYDEHVEELLDEAYEHYVTKKEGSSKQRKRSKKEKSSDDQFLESDGDAILNPEEDYSGSAAADLEKNPLIVPLEEDAPTQDEIAVQWFSQDVFMDTDEKEEQPDKFISDDEMHVEEPVVVKMKPPEPVDGGGFEVVPAPATDSSDSSSSSDDDSDGDGVEEKAEILACAKKMLRKKPREQMLDDAYNKYMFHDDGGLPRWFLDEERRHRRPVKP
ncbi:hypothetical protein M569_10656, partial [Genlisea aurea]